MKLDLINSQSLLVKTYLNFPDGVEVRSTKETTLIADNLSFQERAEEFMKDWVTDGLGVMEVYMRNVVTGETRFVKNDGKGCIFITS
jgi:hypothetical protein